MRAGKKHHVGLVTFRAFGPLDRDVKGRPVNFPQFRVGFDVAFQRGREADDGALVRAFGRGRQNQFPFNVLVGQEAFGQRVEFLHAHRFFDHIIHGGL